MVGLTSNPGSFVPGKPLGVTLLEATFGADPKGSSSVCQSTWSCRGPWWDALENPTGVVFSVQIVVGSVVGFWLRSFNDWKSGGFFFVFFAIVVWRHVFWNGKYRFPASNLPLQSAILGGKEKGIDPVSKDGRGELVETKHGQGSLKETRWWSFKDFFIFTFYLGTWSNLTILQMGFRRFFT